MRTFKEKTKKQNISFACSGDAMVYVRAGTVSEQPSVITRVLDLPMMIYQFFMFFIMTLIDVRALPACAHNRLRCAPRI